MKIVTFFNNKGGAEKTSLVYHFAYPKPSRKLSKKFFWRD